MEASIVDLRYDMAKIRRVLDRSEDVIVKYRGKPKYIMMLLEKHDEPKTKKPKKTMRIEDDPFFGSLKDDGRDINEIMHEMRSNSKRQQYHNLLWNARIVNGKTHPEDAKKIKKFLDDY